MKNTMITLVQQTILMSLYPQKTHLLVVIVTIIVLIFGGRIKDKYSNILVTIITKRTVKSTAKHRATICTWPFRNKWQSFLKINKNLKFTMKTYCLQQLSSIKECLLLLFKCPATSWTYVPPLWRVHPVYPPVYPPMSGKSQWNLWLC